MKTNLNRTQMAGLALVGLSLVTLLGGGIFASSWLAAVEPAGVNIYVKDADTGQHISKELVTVTVTGANYMGYDVPFNVVLFPSKTTPTYWGFNSHLLCLYYISVTATGYVSQTGTVSMPQNFIKEYTYKLSPEPPQGEPEPEPVPPEEPEPVELEAEVYVNGVKAGVGDTITLDTLSLTLRVAIIQGSVQQVWGFVDEERVSFELGEAGEYTASYTLPGDGSYDVAIRTLDMGGEDRPLASFAAVFGAAEDPEDPVDEVDDAVEEALGRTTTLLSAALACMGAGVYMLGSLKEEKRR